MKFRLVTYILLFMLNPAMGFPLSDKSMDGREIATKVYDRDTGKDSYAEVKMLLIDKGGHKKYRSLVTATKDYDGLKKSYTRFTEPADIDGTAFLTWENKNRDDDQFLYLPSLKRVRRIVSSQKKSRFVNTDYTYEDMQTRDVDEDRHQLLTEEKYQGYECWVLESTPLSPDDTQYGKRISWIVKDAYIPIKVEYYNHHGQLVKRYRAAVLKKVDGIWTAMEYEMHDLEREHKTLMKLVTIRYNNKLDDKMFTQTYLQYAK